MAQVNNSNKWEKGNGHENQSSKLILVAAILKLVAKML